MLVPFSTSLSGLLLFVAAGADRAPGADSTAGKLIFEEHCALCHGLDGGGGRGPDLRRAKLSHAAADEALKSLIENGIPPEMPDGSLYSKEDIANIAAFVRTLGMFRRKGCQGIQRAGKNSIAAAVVRRVTFALVKGWGWVRTSPRSEPDVGRGACARRCRIRPKGRLSAAGMDDLVAFLAT